ncbi:MAG: gluconate 2-dehydrogenase subunit 3 family protein [bacterium]
MNRREAVARLFAITGTMAVGGELFLAGCRAPEAAKRTVAFSTADIALMDEIADTIIPATDTPGAKAAKVGAFMAMTAHDCYDDASYASLRGGLQTIDDASRKRHGKSFMDSTPADRTTLLDELDADQRAHTLKRSAGEPVHYFRLMKELTLIGYFSSEIGCTKALRYVESPGSYDGNAPYKKGDRAWYNPSRRIG